MKHLTTPVASATAAVNGLASLAAPLTVASLRLGVDKELKLLCIQFLDALLTIMDQRQNF
jgi:hypothetical protein